MCSSPTYPTVVMVTKDHHIPSREPQKKDFGKSTWFHFISCKREKRYNWLEKNVLKHLTTTKRIIRPQKGTETSAKTSLENEGLRNHSFFTTIIACSRGTTVTNVSQTCSCENVLSLPSELHTHVVFHVDFAENERGMFQNACFTYSTVFYS